MMKHHGFARDDTHGVERKDTTMPHVPSRNHAAGAACQTAKSSNLAESLAARKGVQEGVYVGRSPAAVQSVGDDLRDFLRSLGLDARRLLQQFQ